MLVLSYSLRPAMMIGVHVASKRSIELCSCHNLRSIPQNPIDEVHNSNSLNDLCVELISRWIWDKCIVGNLLQVVQMCELTCAENAT